MLDYEWLLPYAQPSPPSTSEPQQVENLHQLGGINQIIHKLNQEVTGYNHVYKQFRVSTTPPHLAVCSVLFSNCWAGVDPGNIISIPMRGVQVGYPMR